MKKNNIPLYTPSVLEPETLQAMFVKREKLLDSLVKKHKESVLNTSKAFSLLVGPRGMGKTHLISMLYHKLKQDNELKGSMLIAWLREEEWGISSYLDLLIQILRSINREYNNIDNTEIETLFEYDLDDAEYKAEKLIETLLANKVLVVLAENLNIIFDGLDKSGQEKLRAFIQNTGKITIAAATQALFASVTARSKPFYGFFTVTHLQKFMLQDAINLLINIATRDKNKELLEVLKTDEGRSRIRALHHLAGGNPRIYVLFSQFIQADTLDGFTGPILKMLDELTPYYQAKMMELSPQQRKLIMFLCRESGAVTVQELAKKNHISQQTASSQLKKLKESGFVESTQYGRQSYYEIAEPLLRMVLSVKDNRGAPVELDINLIRHFFTIDELKGVKGKTEISLLGIKCLTQDIINAAIEDPNPNPHVIAAIKDFELAFEKRDFVETQKIVKEVNKENKDEFSNQFLSFLLKVFRGKFNTYFKVAQDLLFAIPYDFDNQRDVLLVLLVTLQKNQKNISSRQFYILINQLSEIDQSVLYSILFLDLCLQYTGSIHFNTNKSDPLLVELITRGIDYYFNSDSQYAQDLEWLSNIIQFINNNSSYDYLSILISCVVTNGDVHTQENIKSILGVLVNANSFDISHVFTLIGLSTKSFDQVLFDEVSNLIDHNKEYKALYEFKNIISNYMKSRNPKELISLPKEVRSLILNNIEE